MVVSSLFNIMVFYEGGPFAKSGSYGKIQAFSSTGTIDIISCQILDQRSRLEIFTDNVPILSVSLCQWVLTSALCF